MLVRLLIRYQKLYNSRTKLKQERKNNWPLLTHCSQKVLLKIAFLRAFEDCGIWTFWFHWWKWRLRAWGLREIGLSLRNIILESHTAHKTIWTLKRQMLSSCIVKKEYKLDYTFLNMAAGHEFLNSYLIYHHPKFWRTPSMFSQAHQKYQHQHQLLQSL